MKRTSFRHHRLLAVLGLSLVLPWSAARADVVIMKPTAGETEGKQYKDAKVLSETADSITFEYFPVANIRDTKTVKKEEVAQVIRQKPEELEIVPLRALAQLPDLSTSDKYEMVIKDSLLPFVNKYAGTPQAAEVQEMIKTLQTEKEKVVSGAVKMDGKWLTAEQAKRDARELEAYKVRREIRELAGKNDLKGALNTWVKMKDKEEGYTDTLQYVQAIPEIQEILKKYKAILDAQLAQQPGLVAARKKNLASLVEPDLGRAQRAYDKEDANFKAIADMERQTRVAWSTTYRYDIKSIQEGLKDVSTEVAQLTVLDLEKVKAQNEHIAAARRYLADGNLEQAEASIARAQSVSIKDGSRVLQKVRNEAAALRNELNRKKTNSRIFGGNTTTVPSATSFGNKPGQDDRVAAATAAADSKATQMAETKAKGGDEKPSTGTGLTSLDTAGKQPATKSNAPANDDAPTKPKRPVVAEEDPLQTYLLYGGAGLLAVLLIAMFLQKRRK
jgi:hypothetical protein